MMLQVRAANLQELVYKQGQAGVTKATVSVTWHNNHPETGPAGYEDKEYITVTRQVLLLAHATQLLLPIGECMAKPHWLAGCHPADRCGRSQQIPHQWACSTREVSVLLKCMHTASTQ